MEVTGSSTGNVTVNWSGTANGTSVGVMLPNTINGLAAGTYTVYYTDETTLFVSPDSIKVIVNPGAPIITLILDTISCNVDYTIPDPLTAIEGTLLTGDQNFYFVSGGAIADLIPTGFVFTVANTPAIIYVFDANGDCSNEVEFSVTVNVLPIAVVSNTGPACEGVQITLNETGGAGTSLDWSSVNGSATITNSTSQNALVHGAVNGEEFLATITDANGCVNSSSTIISLITDPNVISMTGGNNYCPGDVINDILVEVTGSPNWSIDYTLEGVVSNVTGTISPINLGNAEGAYVLTNITDDNCSNTAVGTQTIVVNALPLAPIAGTDSEYCSTVTFDNMTAVGSGGALTWYSDAGLTSVIAIGSSLEPANTEGGTTYYVTETLNGCEGPASQVEITINNCSITIPTAFTPNNDEVNDDWEILDIDQTYPENIVYVYNRWGNLLFTSIQGDYDNNRWDGTFKGKNLPVGSYYFIIEFNDKNNEKKNGVVSIILN